MFFFSRRYLNSDSYSFSHVVNDYQEKKSNCHHLSRRGTRFLWFRYLVHDGVAKSAVPRCARRSGVKPREVLEMYVYKLPELRLAQRTLAVIEAETPSFNHKDERLWPSADRTILFWRAQGIEVDPKRLLDRIPPKIELKVNELLARSIARKAGPDNKPWQVVDMQNAEQDLLYV